MTIFLFWVVFSILVAVYADKKGRSGVGFFFLALLASPLVGFLVALLAEPKRAKVAANTGKKKCPDCGEYVLREARICRFCRHEFWAEVLEPAIVEEPAAPTGSDFDAWSKEAIASESANQPATAASSAASPNSLRTVISYLIVLALIGLAFWYISRT